VTYAEFRTGLTYRDVYHMLWSGSDDPRDWRYKRRHTVLGFWRQLKLQLWQQYLDAVDAESYAAAAADRGDAEPWAAAS
jgi:hypothetical protein